MNRQITVAVCGYGSRGGDAYATYQLSHPEDMKVVAVADNREIRRDLAMEQLGLAPECCFASGEELLAQPKLADVMVIATMDQDHYKYAIPALEKGYHLLLEKPISPDLKECLEIQKKAKECGKIVMVCHVLRYAPFYETVKALIDAGKIGRLEQIQASENVGYWHFAHSFTRGNWRSAKESSPLIMQKSCHDMDILRWLVGKPCKKVSSFGRLDWFRAENAPEGSALRCVDCKAKEDCPYDAEKIYLTNQRTGFFHGNTAWPCNVLTGGEVTEEKLREAIQIGPYGRCVYHCDNDVVDHQTVNLEFEDGVTATFSLAAFSADCHRTIYAMGTLGEIRGDAEENTIVLHQFGKAEEVIRLDLAQEQEEFSGHGGGDERMMAELCRYVRENCTDTRSGIEASVESHVMALAAEESRKCGGKVIALADYISEHL